MLNLHESPITLHEGTMPNRSHYIPFGNTDSLCQCRHKSDRVLMLNGEWDFRYFDRYIDVPDEIEYERTIPVPSVWQQHGYDSHQYTNVRYPFPYDPPYVPMENPCGAYRRAFNLEKLDGERYYLVFEGVDSCYYLYVNGQYAGFSQVSHSTSEFDITDFVDDGENELEVRVLKWCFGSYLEDQDKLRMSGIFRDVMILSRPINHVRDFFIHTDIHGDSATVRVDFEFEGAPVKVTCAFNGEEKAVEHGSALFEVTQPKLWTAETPDLYPLVISANGEHILQQVGIREIKVVDGVVMLNGVAIKFRGVNRHDSDPVTGYAISYEQMVRDMRVMKRHNINAIRTSHYPNAPFMPELADELGFYVIGESDIESHGVVAILDTEGEPFNEKYSSIARMDMFKEAILDRVQLNVMRDKNRASIVIWSMGNESGFGENFENALKWTKSFDPSRLTHYEGWYNRPEARDNDESNLDLYSRMYPSLEQIETYFETKQDPRPYIMCEYIHAMGNGPGDVWDYQQLIDKYPGLVGGFVWEFCDHAMYMGRTPDLKDKYFYGGDWGEFPHDDNFCMDGLVYPDRTPHTGFFEVKNVFRPIRAELVNEKTVRLTNYLDFTCAKDAATGLFELTQDGELIDSGVFELPRIAPHKSGEVELPLELPKTGKLLLKLTYLQKDDSALTSDGHELGFDQLVLRDGIVAPEAKQVSGAKLAVSETATEIVIESADLCYTFDKLAGNFSALCYKNRPLVTKPVEYNLWRAPTDNDRNIRHEWEAAGYDMPRPRVYSATAAMNGDAVVIDCELSLAATYRQRILTIRAKFKVSPNGNIAMSFDCEKNTVMPILARFGLRLFVPKTCTRVEYFGYGPLESYVDKHRASWLGKFETTARLNHEDYIKPQENGSHWNTEYVSIEGGLTASSDVPFSFNVSPYTQEELTLKPHNFELAEAEDTVLCLDYKLSGIGSASCGPKLLEKYWFNEDKFNFNLNIRP